MGNEWPIVWSVHLRHRTGTRLEGFNNNIQVPQRETEATSSLRDRVCVAAFNARF